MKLKDVINAPTKVMVRSPEGWVNILMTYLGVDYNHLLKSYPQIADATVIDSLSSATVTYIDMTVEKVLMKTSVLISLPNDGLVTIDGKVSYLG